MVYVHQLWKKNCVLRENTHNTRNFQKICNENRKTVKYGIGTI